jgi:hypothetical protein
MQAMGLFIFEINLWRRGQKIFEAVLNSVDRTYIKLVYVLKWTIFIDNCFDFPFNVTPLAGFLRSPLGGGKPEILPSGNFRAPCSGVPLSRAML